MKLIPKICFPALLCLYRSHQTTPSRGQGAELPSRGQGAKLSTIFLFFMTITLATAQDQNTVRIYVELQNNGTQDSLEFLFWDNIIKENTQNPPPHIVSPSPEKGHFFDGSNGYLKYTATHNPSEEFIRFTIKLNGQPILNNYILEAGSGLRVRINTKELSLAFGGSASTLAETQYQLSNLFNNRTFNNPPLMVSASPEKLITNPKFSEVYASSDLNLMMRFLYSPQSNRKYLDHLLQVDPLKDPAFRILESARENIGDHAASIFKADIYARLLPPIIDQFSRTFPTLEQTPDTYIQKILPLLHIPLDDLYAYSPLFVESVLEISKLKASLYVTKFFDTLDSLPSALRDRAYARFILDNFSVMENPKPYFDRAIAGMNTPWIRDLITEVMDPRLPGKELPDIQLFDSDLNPVPLSSFEGKKVMATFWITGCKFCIMFKNQVLDQLYSEWKDRDDIILLSINSDKDPLTWQKSLDSGQYVPNGMVSLWAGSETGNIAEELSIQSFPYKMLLDENRKILLPAIQSSNPEMIRRKIKEYLSEYIP